MRLSGIPLILSLFITYCSAQTFSACTRDCLIRLNARTGNNCGFADPQCICRLGRTNRIFEDCISTDCAAGEAAFARQLCASFIAGNPLPGATAPVPSFSSAPQPDLPTISLSNPTQTTIPPVQPTFTYSLHTLTSTASSTAIPTSPSGNFTSKSQPNLLLIISATLLGVGLTAGLVGLFWYRCCSKREKATKLAPGQGTFEPVMIQSAKAPPVLPVVATSSTTPRQSFDSSLEAGSFTGFDPNVMVSAGGGLASNGSVEGLSPTESLDERLANREVDPLEPPAGGEDHPRKSIETIPRGGSEAGAPIGRSSGEGSRK